MIDSEQTSQAEVVVGDNTTMADLLGPHDEHARLIERELGVRIQARESALGVSGEKPAVDQAVQLLASFAAMVERGQELSATDVGSAVTMVKGGHEVAEAEAMLSNVILVSRRGRAIAPKTPGQQEYVEAVRQRDLVLCIGPAGTGKTYLAMSMAVAALRSHQVSRIILTRPAVEAGERLGFLPGALEQKVDPYLRPLYDALYDMIDADTCQKLIERRTVEVAPLAYMRGRTLNDSFVILDEAQNTTHAQMKMFLTRMGFGSKVVATGDVTQVDLPRGAGSGLKEAWRILRGVKDVGFVELTDRDVVRHRLVQRIILAYEAGDRSAGRDAEA